ncbi:MAG: hypothetical protein Q7K42_03560, partial [Candidatus Diapherotrites archaeon]|nr:hypothetical protein [Candidatus Diapherotrites archaeon]
MVKVIESYNLEFENLEIEINIVEESNAYVKTYSLNVPEVGVGTKALLDNLRGAIITEIPIQSDKLVDPKHIQELRNKLKGRAKILINKELAGVNEKTKDSLIAMLLNEMLGLGKIEFLLLDKNLEEIVVNSSQEPVWVYHKKYSWLKTNIFLASEGETQNYASIIARRVGKQIT